MLIIIIIYQLDITASALVTHAYPIAARISWGDEKAHQCKDSVSGGDRSLCDPALAPITDLVMLFPSPGDLPSHQGGHPFRF